MQSPNPANQGTESALSVTPKLVVGKKPPSFLPPARTKKHSVMWNIRVPFLVYFSMKKTFREGDPSSIKRAGQKAWRTVREPDIGPNSNIATFLPKPFGYLCVILTITDTQLRGQRSQEDNLMLHKSMVRQQAANRETAASARGSRRPAPAGPRAGTPQATTRGPRVDQCVAAADPGIGC